MKIFVLPQILNFQFYLMIVTIITHSQTLNASDFERFLNIDHSKDLQILLFFSGPYLVSRAGDLE